MYLIQNNLHYNKFVVPNVTDPSAASSFTMESKANRAFLFGSIEAARVHIQTHYLYGCRIIKISWRLRLVKWGQVFQSKKKYESRDMAGQAAALLPPYWQAQAVRIFKEIR